MATAVLEAVPDTRGAAGSAFDAVIAMPDARERSVEHEFRLVYQTYARPIYRFLLRLTLGNRGQAEDHLQETFLRTWRWLQTHPLELDRIRQWLYAVARRIAIDAMRARAVRPIEVVIDHAAEFASGDDDIERLAQVDEVRRALLRLSAGHRAVLVELFYHDRTAKEAASVLGIPEGTVKSRAHHALRALRAAALTEEPTAIPAKPAHRVLR
jgi:RNA polymerase sigma-70 factor (ECF subfamily)